MGSSVHPNQELLEGALNETLSEEEYAEGVKTIRDAAGVNGIDKTLVEFNLDVIIGPMDGRIPLSLLLLAMRLGLCRLGTRQPMGEPLERVSSLGLVAKAVSSKP